MLSSRKTSRRFARLPRDGVSLIEVMIAIGVVAIGILGIIALIPVALHQAGQGIKADRATRLALNAAADFDVRGMANANAFWRTASGATINPPQSVRVGPRVDPTGNGRWVEAKAYAIDPQFVAKWFSDPKTSTRFDATQFPYVIPPSPPLPSSAPSIDSEPRMQRITLASSFGGASLMDLAQAAATFVLDDELVFDVPEDRALPPAQVYSTRREYEGLYSWMATLTPQIEHDGAGDDDKVADAVQKAAYTLSVVVFHRRDPRLAMFDDVNGNDVDDGEPPTSGEVVVDLIDFPGVGFRGGEVVLGADSADDLNLKIGDWIMLQGWFNPEDPRPDPSNPRPHPWADTDTWSIDEVVPLFRWYRVVNADIDPRPPYPDPQDPNSPPPSTTAEAREQLYKFCLDVTLQGADWPDNGAPRYVPNTSNVVVLNPMIARPWPTSRGTPVQVNGYPRDFGITTTAVVVRNVATVYERIIRLETTAVY